MTAAKSIYRRRRAGGVLQVPKYIAQWFAGERAVSFHACSPAHGPRLREYWASWNEAHPDAVPPETFELFARNAEAMQRQTTHHRPNAS